MMNKILFNPFHYIAGYRALAFGLISISIYASIGYFSNMHFPGAISIKTAPDLKYSYFILLSTVNWLIISIVFYVSAKITSNTLVRIVDIFGTMALARYPLVFASLIGFSEALERFTNFFMEKLKGNEEVASISTADMALTLIFIFLMLLISIWVVTLMYYAYKVSANLKGNRLVASFIISVILSIVATNVASFCIYQIFI